MLQDVPHKAPPQRALQAEARSTRRKARSPTSPTGASTTIRPTAAVHPAHADQGRAGHTWSPPGNTWSPSPASPPTFGVWKRRVPRALLPARSAQSAIPCDRQRPHPAAARGTAGGCGRGGERGLPHEAGLQLRGREQFALALVVVVLGGGKLSRENFPGDYSGRTFRETATGQRGTS